MPAKAAITSDVFVKINNETTFLKKRKWCFQRKEKCLQINKTPHGDYKNVAYI